MIKRVQRAALFLILSMIPSIPMLMAQQQPMPPAPIPAQILAAKKVFISNGGDDDLTIPHPAARSSPHLQRVLRRDKELGKI
jgi:hypothetical protein